MAMQNLASKYSRSVDERFHRESQAMMALNNNYKFTGVQTVQVYSLPVVAMNDYQRTGSSRYGQANDLSTNVQTMTVKRDRAFTFIIDKGDKIQSQMVSDAGKALSRQLREVCVPEFDAYVFKTLAAAATARGAMSSEELTKDNAYSMFLAAMEHLGNHNVPDKGRVCFCSYRFANLLKQDPAFMKWGDSAQEMVQKGVIGEVDGCRIVKVPASRLPAGAAFILTHPLAATAPKQLNDYKVHDNPPGISGWLVEGRLIYDCFVLNEKADAVFYHGSQPVLKNLAMSVAATAPGVNTLSVISELEGEKRWYVTAATAAQLPAVAWGETLDTGAFTQLSGSSVDIAVDGGHTVVRLVETDAEGKVIACGDSVLHQA